MDETEKINTTKIQKRENVRKGKKKPLPLPVKITKTVSNDPCKVFFGFTPTVKPFLLGE